MKTYRTIVSIILTIHSVLSFAQFRPLENYPSPNAANLGIYGSFPVNLYTGIPDISIPLYEVTEGDLSLPVTLRYHLASVKPNQRSGWLGLGWSLSAGGSITRNVRGCYDEKQYMNGTEIGFYSNYEKLQNVHNSETLEAHGPNFNGTSSEVYELMTDEYSFSFGNYSGSFYLDENGNWVVVSDHDIKVEFDPLTGFRHLNNLRINTGTWLYRNYNNRFFDRFTLITPDGIRYTFGGDNATEYSINYYNRNRSDLIPTTWYLTRIGSPKGYEINLEYEVGDPICEIQFSAFFSAFQISVDQSTPSITHDFLSWLQTQWLGGLSNMNSITTNSGRNKLAGYLIFPVYLKQIKSSWVRVNFHSRTELDTNQDDPPHKDFLVWSNSGDGDIPLVPSFFSPYAGSFKPEDQFHVFMSSSVPSTIPNLLHWRVLNGISIEPVKWLNGNIVRDEDRMMYAKSYYFSYYRGYKKGTLAPSSGRKKLVLLAERKGLYQMESYWIDGGEMAYLDFRIPQAIGYVPKDYMFDYYMDEILPRYVFAKVDHWGYNKGGETKLSDNYEFNQSFYDARDATPLITVATAETLKEIRYPTGGKTVFKYEQHDYSKIVPVSCSAELINESGIAGGLRISAIFSYDESSKLLLEKKYYYSDTISGTTLGISSGILKEKKRYGISYYSQDGSYMILCSEGGFLTHGTNRTENHVSYSSVIEQTLDANGNPTGFVRYRYTSHDKDIWGNKHRDESALYSNNTSGNIDQLFTTSLSQERGKLTSEEFFTSNGQLVKSVMYQYHKTPDLAIRTPYQDCIIIYPHLSSYITLNPAVMANTHTYRYFLEKETTTEYQSHTGNILNKIEKNYTYNPGKLLQSETIRSSKGESIDLSFRYTGDYLSFPATDTVNSTVPYSLIKNSHILNKLVSKTKRIKKGDVFSILESELYEYKKEIPIDSFEPDQKMLLPVKRFVFDSENNTDPTNGIFCNLAGIDSRFKLEESYMYNSKGNICEIKNKNGGVISYIWSYNGMYPVVEGVNITYNTLIGLDSLGFTYNASLLNLETKLPDEDDWLNITGLPAQFPKAQISTFQYIPLIGRKSVTDPRGMTTFYSYDVFGRLKEVYTYRNASKTIIEAYDYHYQKK